MHPVARGLPLRRVSSSESLCKAESFPLRFPQKKMGVTAMLMLPLLLLGISGLLFIYQEVSRLWSKSAVQNKVVVITDAISGLGKGKPALPPPCAHSRPEGRGAAGRRAATLLGGRGIDAVSSPRGLSLTSKCLLFWGLQLLCSRNGGIGRATLANSQPWGQNGSADVICFCLHGVLEILKCKVLRWGGRLGRWVGFPAPSLTSW